MSGAAPTLDQSAQSSSTLPRAPMARPGGFTVKSQGGAFQQKFTHSRVETLGEPSLTS